MGGIIPHSNDYGKPCVFLADEDGPNQADGSRVNSSGCRSNNSPYCLLNWTAKFMLLAQSAHSTARRSMRVRLPPEQSSVGGISPAFHLRMAELFKDPHALPYLVTTAELSTIKCKSKSGDSSAYGALAGDLRRVWPICQNLAKPGPESPRRRCSWHPHNSECISNLALPMLA